MNKKNLIIILFSIFFFLFALAIFLYANTLNKSKKNSFNNEIVVPEATEPTTSSSHFYDLEGNIVSFDDFEELPYTILLWKSDNSKSYDMIKLMEKYYDTYKDKINFLAINVNEPDLDLNLIESVKAIDFKIPMYFDTDQILHEEFPYEKLPEIIFLNSDREIEKECIEQIDEDTFTANLDLLAKNY